MLNVFFYIFTMSMLNVELVSRVVFRSTFADDFMFVNECVRFLDDYVMKGCCVFVCPGTKVCSRLQSFVLRGSAECRWDRGESSEAEVWMFLSRWGRERVCSVLLLSGRPWSKLKGALVGSSISSGRTTS